jgi:hypothetical protein
MSFERLKNLDLPFHLAFLDWFKSLDHCVFVIHCRDASVDFRILALADFGDDLEFVDIAEIGQRVTRTRFQRLNSYNSSIPFSY